MRTVVQPVHKFSGRWSLLCHASGTFEGLVHGGPQAKSKTEASNTDADERSRDSLSCLGGTMTSGTSLVGIATFERTRHAACDAKLPGPRPTGDDRGFVRLRETMAAEATGLGTLVSPHTFRHYFSRTCWRAVKMMYA
jgi:hypothetical protein